MEVLSKMAQLIVENPAITVHELAAKLGYSEEKSVYYWLEKGKFGGIKDFRRAVLTGKFPAPEFRYAPTRGEEQLKEDDTLLRYSAVRLPLVGNLEEYEGPPPVAAQATSFVLTQQAVSPAAFATVVNVDTFAPAVKKGDILVVDPLRQPADGDLVMARLPGQGTQVRVLFFRRYLLHPADHKDVSRITPGDWARVIIGKVVQLIRNL